MLVTVAVPVSKRIKCAIVDVAREAQAKADTPSNDHYQVNKRHQPPSVPDPLTTHQGCLNRTCSRAVQVLASEYPALQRKQVVQIAICQLGIQIRLVN